MTYNTLPSASVHSCHQQQFCDQFCICTGADSRRCRQAGGRCKCVPDRIELKAILLFDFIKYCLRFLTVNPTQMLGPAVLFTRGVLALYNLVASERCFEVGCVEFALYSHCPFWRGSGRSPRTSVWWWSFGREVGGYMLTVDEK